MKHTLLLLFLLLTTLQATKTDFSVIVHKPFNAELFDVTQDYDRTITAVGFSKEYKKSSIASRSYTDPFEYLANASGSFGSQMHILKVDKQAKIILSKMIKLSKFNKAIAVVKTPSNGYFVGGYTLDGSLLIAKLDANANIVFVKMFGTKNYDRMNNLILMSDGGVLAIGSSITSRNTNDNMFNSGLGNNDIFITRFSKDGHKLWSKKYGTVHDDQGIDAVEAKDGSILVLSATSYNKNRDVSFMRLTENGNKIWLKHYQQEANSDNTIIPKKIIRLKDGNFVVVLAQYNHMQKEHIRIVKFDLYQNILIDKKIFTTYPSALNDIKEFSDGTFIGVGYIKDVSDTDGLVMIFDANLVLLNKEHYGGENYDIFHAAKILNNSQVAVVGAHTDDLSQETNMWIVKLHKDASMTQISLNNESIYKKLIRLFKKEIQRKELVIKKDLSIEFTDKRLYFSIGAYKLTKTQKIYLNKFNKKLINFLYQNKNYIQTLEVNGHTSSEWGHSNFTQRYLNNEKLSLNRSYEVMSTIFTSSKREIQIWLSDILKGSGNSYAKNIKYNGIESKKKSRRVILKVILK